MKLSPLGMETCATCDAPTTHAVDSGRGEWVPSCAACAREEKAAFPDVRVMLYAPRVKT